MTSYGRGPRRSSRARFGVRLVLALALIGAVFSIATITGSEASTLTSGDGFTSLSTQGTVAANTPYTSGQVINIDIAANSTMSTANLIANNGGLTGPIKFLECADPGGLPANLPTKSTECEPGTVQPIAGLSSDGSGHLDGSGGYTVYALPDVATLGPSNGTICDAGLNPCVIGIFANQNDFTKPHLFSAPFYVSVGDGHDLGDNPGDGSPLAATSTSATNSTVVASPSSATADGVDSSKVTVVLKDSNGVPVTTSKQVTISSNSSTAVIKTGGVVSSTAATDSTGTATFAVTDSVAEPVTFTVTDTSDNSLHLSTQPVVTFGAPVVTPVNSSVSAQPAVVAQANGTDASQITVTLDDQASSPQPVSGKVISLAQNGHSVITAISSTTSAQGVATFSVTDTTPETVTYTATDSTDHVTLTNESVTVQFGTISVSPSASTITATPTVVSSVPSGSQLPKGTVTVTLLAADGISPVSGKSVTLTASPSAHAVVTANSTATDSNGQETFSVSDSSAEGVTFTAVDSTDSVNLTHSAAITFAVPAASASNSVLTASVTSAAADGITPVTLNVTIKDQFGNPLAGRVVTIAASPSLSTRVAPQTVSSSVAAGTTDGNGEAEFIANDTTAETVVYSATDTSDGASGVIVSQTVSVTFTSGLPQVSQSSITSSPASVPADGTTSSTVTVLLLDHNGNPVVGKTIQLIQSGHAQVSPPTVATNAQGQALFTVVDGTAELVNFSANDMTDLLPLVGVDSTVTFGSPPPTLPTIADSSIVVSQNKVPGDGSSIATVSVLLSDSNGLGLSGKQVSLSPSGGSSKIATVAGTTDSSGLATFAVSDAVAEAVTYTATDSTDAFPLTGLSVTVTFTSAPSLSTSPATGLNRPIVGIARTPDNGGYWLVASDGGIFTYGDAGFYGSAGGGPLNRPIVGMASTPDGNGYWLVASDGGIFSYGDAKFFGSTGNITLNKPIVGMAATPDGMGYWLVASDGGIFAFGDGTFYGSTGDIQLNRPIVGMSATPDGLGYWLVASDGGIFTFGDATFYGSTGNVHLNKPIVGMAATTDGKGYWMVASDGGIFNFADATFDGSGAALNLNRPVVGMVATSDGRAYWLVATDGGVITSINAPFYGSRA